jgi:hypothetical protein
MKVLCNACEAAEAVVMCCADEAALCLVCDERVHAANKLAGKHQRISLMSSSGTVGGGGGASCSVPKCDICQVSLTPLHPSSPTLCAVGDPNFF